MDAAAHVESTAHATSSVRVDSWVWAVRLTKTRSLATTACRAGHIRVNGDRAKAAHPLHVSDEVRVRMAGSERIVVVSRLVTKRVSALVAAGCYVDTTPPPPAREVARAPSIRDRGAGRPTKRERREIDRLRGR